ncbi:LPS export ABC transporter periplasmic protein LptC [Janthinobacterium agaricidamnosum]|uniref:LPS export ABC transporter periplasmic protein LptC n=1 Tax=Janthinobacterium agaricidamnosum TaxID=55508 RepID=UPI001F57C463|nr:LPS export ABC transporter periplasmic protein LptC [Janthinobacterium agaricidamnosum]
MLQVINGNGLNFQAGKPSNEPDYVVTNFSLVRMTPAGQPSYIVSGTRLTHYPLDDASEIDKPFVRKLSDSQQPPLDTHAERARIDQGNSRVQLFENVLIQRDASPTAKNLTLKTQQLTVFPDTDKMETALPVDMVLGTSHLTGVGMKADNAASQVEILHQLKIDYPPVRR